MAQRLFDIQQLLPAREMDRLSAWEGARTAFEKYFLDVYERQDDTDFEKCLNVLREFKVIEPKIKLVKTDTEESTKNVVKTSSNGPRVQTYDPHDFTKVIKVYPSITEAVRAVKDSSYSQIKFAFKNNLLYLGYRWNLLHSSDDATLAAQMNPTVENKQVRKVDKIAMMDLDKTRIIKVFLLQKDAAEFVMQDPSAICTALRFKSPIANHVWMFLGDVDENILEEWTRHNEIPETTGNKRGVKVQQVDMKTNKLVKTFASITDVVKEMQMSPNTIKQYITSQKPYKGFIWSFVASV
jgi:hypothetical protein